MGSAPPADGGAHGVHRLTEGMQCKTCHNNSQHGLLGNDVMEFGFNIYSGSWPNFLGRVTTGTINIGNDPSITWDDNEGQWWMGDCHFTYNGVSREYYQPPVTNRPPDQQSMWNIYPMHAGGTSNILLGDGSVRGITTNIDLIVWSAMITPAGGEAAVLPQ